MKRCFWILLAMIGYAQAATPALKPDPQLAAAASRIDQAVAAKLREVKQGPSPQLTEEQFVRRAYLDLVGRIPANSEVRRYLADPRTSAQKRTALIDSLLVSEGASSHLFNWAADMLRIADRANKTAFYTYEEWLKGQIEQNRPWNEVVHEMLTADGKLIENGATGYLLRDAGMRLDNLSNTLTVFLGANVSCAQCHDHPFADWTQKDFYQMAAYFGATETADGRRPGRQMLRGVAKMLDRKEIQRARVLVRANAQEVEDKKQNELTYPADYQYPNAKPGSRVEPALISWEPEDKRSSVYPTSTATPSELREQFATWLTHQNNPRFAMTLANRLWRQLFGLGVCEPVTDLDDPAQSSNPALLKILAEEMKRLNFDLRAFIRLLANTQAWQRQAVARLESDTTPFAFCGPVLRRISAEQAWDSCLTLIVGPRLDEFKSNRAATYVETMKLDLDSADPQALAAKVKAMPKAIAGAFAPGKAKKKGKAQNQAKKEDDTALPEMMMNEEVEEDEVPDRPPPRLFGLVLARASELPQPEREFHFLRQFGQSDRQLTDGSSEEGSIPQVLMLMNGEVQDLLSRPRVAVQMAASLVKTQEEKIASLYLSFFSRQPSVDEVNKAKEALSQGLTLGDLAWVLFNSREFIFIQ